MIFMNDTIRILSVSDDEGLRLSRELLLRNCGYEIESVTSYDLLGVSYVRTFEIALICTSIQATRVGPLIEKLCRYNPGIQTLDMDDLQFKAEVWSEVTSPVVIGPDLLLNTLRDMCARTGKGVAHPLRYLVKGHRDRRTDWLPDGRHLQMAKGRKA